MDQQKFYGKFRGRVTDNTDPMQIGRICAEVPDVSALLPTTWATPCVAVAGPSSGIFVLPQVGAGVWIEFEQGDPNHPIWVGGFWGAAGEVPKADPPPPSGNPPIILLSPNGNRLAISDAAGPEGGIVLKSPSGAVITVNDAGISLDNGKGAKIVMTGPSVSVNDGALLVM